MTKVYKPWIPLEKVDLFVQVEPALIILGLGLGAWVGYKLFLGQISEERHRTLKRLFNNLFYHLLFGISAFSLYEIFHELPFEEGWLERAMIYSGLATLLSGTVVFVKTCRILFYEYFFISHMKVPFPRLLVNIFTLVLSLMLASWVGTEFFNIRLAPILATSAIFSLVLGLALQDTLGNLFSGVALQLDKPYEIGDWIEVHASGQKWAGQVYEITWRATILIAVGDEVITIPNRVMGQAQISNFATKYRPIARIQIIRLPYKVDLLKTKDLLRNALNTVPEIRKNPAPNVLIADTNESGVAYKLLYSIDNYGEQFTIFDKILTACLKALNDANYPFAAQRIEVINKS
ncbi:MAG: mechanosensitive ion channel family protein [Bdellovibrio sp.]|nr:mechanosensitive ion channel family protein [Bdellovibrio sp.]